MDAKPEWVPEWVWVEYQQHHQWRTRYPAAEGATDFASVVLRDKGCDAVWKAVDRRKGIPTKRLRARLLAKYGDQEWFAFPGEAMDLFHRINFALGWIPDALVIPKSERKKTGIKIARLANALRDELRALEQRTTIDYYPFLYSMEPMVMALARNDTTSKDAHSFEYGVQVGMDNIDYALLAIAASAEAWAETKPVIPRPKDEHARRLYFMRDLTAYFRERYDQPLREAVAGLTRALFECDMDAATVAKLAP